MYHYIFFFDKKKKKKKKKRKKHNLKKQNSICKTKENLSFIGMLVLFGKKKLNNVIEIPVEKFQKM